MFDHNKLLDALRDHDVVSCVNLVGAGGLQDMEAAEEFVLAVRQSGCLLVKFANAADEARRDSLVAKCREMLSSASNDGPLKDFEAHVEDARYLERGFREIVESRAKSDIVTRSAGEQAWGVLHRSGREFLFLKGELDKVLAAQGQQEHPSLDPRQVLLPTEQGGRISPDAVVTGMVKSTGITLSFLAHQNRWFDKSGVLVLPPELPDEEKTAYQAGTHGLLATQWHHLEHAWDRARLFKARVRVREQEFPGSQGDLHRCQVLEIQSPGREELADFVAQERLLQVIFQTQTDSELGGMGKVVIVSQADQSKPLFPDAVLSREEWVAGRVLNSRYCVPMEDGSQIFQGLPLKAWLRGYACLARLARDSDDQPVLSLIRFSDDGLIKKLQEAGLQEEQARQFIQLTLFQRNVADLFDAPLLRTSDGNIFFFAGAYQSPTLGVILLSRLASLNRRRDADGNIENDCRFEDKGKRFEKRIVDLFTGRGIPAHQFKYRLNNTDYDCDAAVLLNDTLFVFECKNYSLPMGHLPSLYYFLLELESQTNQASRISKDLNDHPDIVRQHFGSGASWKRVVPVVLQALPWSSGLRNGVYVYDASALEHFMMKGFCSISCVSRIGPHYIQRRHRYQQRNGDTPTADELVREMDNPSQLRLHSAGVEPVANPVAVSDGMVFSFPEWRKKELTVEEQLRALGSSPEEAARVANDMTEEFPEKVNELRRRLDAKKSLSRKKVGRNDLCPCESGKKYKKCCLGRSKNVSDAQPGGEGHA